MKAVYAIIGILIFWIFLFIEVNFLMMDDFITGVEAYSINASSYLNASEFQQWNITNEEVSGTTNPTMIWDTIVFMFGFQLPQTQMHHFFVFVFPFINYVLLILLLLSIFVLIRGE